MPPPNLCDEDRAILAELLRDIIERDRFPYSPRIRSLAAILAKLEPPAATAETLPPPKPIGERSMTRRRRPF